MSVGRLCSVSNKHSTWWRWWQWWLMSISDTDYRELCRFNGLQSCWHEHLLSDSTVRARGSRWTLHKHRRSAGHVCLSVMQCSNAVHRHIDTTEKRGRSCRACSCVKCSVCFVQYCVQLVMVTWWDGHVVCVDGQRTKHRGVSRVEAATCLLKIPLNPNRLSIHPSSGAEAVIQYDTIEEFNVDLKAEYSA